MREAFDLILTDMFGVTLAQLVTVFALFHFYNLVLRCLPAVKEIRSHFWKFVVRVLHLPSGHYDITIRGKGRLEE